MSDLIPYVETASAWDKSLWYESPSAGWLGTICNTTTRLYGRFIVAPLARLYLWGPNIGGWGFWQGQEMHDICAQQTSYSSDFWREHPTACAEIVSKKFYSFLVVLQTAVYFLILFLVIKAIYRFLCYCKRCPRKEIVA